MRVTESGSANEGGMASPKKRDGDPGVLRGEAVEMPGRACFGHLGDDPADLR